MPSEPNGPVTSEATNRPVDRELLPIQQNEYPHIRDGGTERDGSWAYLPSPPRVLKSSHKIHAWWGTNGTGCKIELE